MKPLLYVLIFTLAGSLLCLDASIAADANEDRATRSPLVVLTSNDSHVSKADYQKIRSKEAWKKTWLNHLGMKNDTIHRPAMEVDFSRCMVIAIFRGNSTNSRGYKVDSVLEDRDMIVVRFVSISYQTEGPNGGANRVTPYAFVVLPKSDKPVVLEENVQSIKGQDPSWKEVAQLR